MKLQVIGGEVESLEIWPKTAEVYALILRNHPRVVRYEEFTSLCNSRIATTMQVSLLRKALASVGITDSIRTVWGVGYALRAPLT